jgi:antibiotic biosynthesis monooxygenase (ABM) superfamily enzyme
MGRKDRRPVHDRRRLPGHVLKDIKAACTGAKCVCEMEVRFDSAGGAQMMTSQAQVDAWLEQLKKLR